MLDDTFGNNGLAVIPVTEEDNEFAAVQVQQDGKIVAAGHISNGLSWFSLLLARFDSNGALDPSFGTEGVVNLNLGNVDDEFYDLRITASGDIIATGFTTTQVDLNYHMLVMKFSSDGIPDEGFGDEGIVTWGGTPYNVGYAMEILPDDKIIIAGSSGEKAPGDADWGIWKLNSDGSFDQSFGNGGLILTDGGAQFDEALGIIGQEDGKILAAGKFRINDNIDFGVARYLNDLSVSVPEVPGREFAEIFPNPVRKNGNLSIMVQITEEQPVSLELSDIAGKVLMRRSLGTQDSGMLTFQTGLPGGIRPGIYILRISGSKSEFVSSRIMIVE
jgi:uncharacterized delta-60 repeat protein